MIIRKLLVGIILGGGFGAKIGAYLSTMLTPTVSQYFIETGFTFGIVIGLTLSGMAVVPSLIRSMDRITVRDLTQSLRTSG